MINAGQLDERVTLQAKAATQNALGEVTGAWADVATVWAKVEPLRGREFFASGQMNSSVDHRVTIRWRSGVVPTMRLQWRGQPLEVISVIEPSAARTVLELMCASGIRSARE